MSMSSLNALRISMEKVSNFFIHVPVITIPTRFGTDFVLFFILGGT